MGLPNVFLWSLLVVVVLVLLVPVQWSLCPISNNSRDLRRWMTVSVLVMVALFSLLALSGCGTAPLQVQTSPPVPAALLIPPRPPVLLQPQPPSTTPGPTTVPTPKPAPKTGWRTNA